MGFLAVNNSYLIHSSQRGTKKKTVPPKKPIPT